MLKNLLKHVQAIASERLASGSDTDVAAPAMMPPATPTPVEPRNTELAGELDRLATAEREERDRQREIEIAALRERAKFD
jgi:hypothetical protein